MIVAFKFRDSVNGSHRVIVSAETAGLARTAALLFHGGLKASFVNFNVAFAAHVRRQVDREAVGVVQTEGRFAIQRVAFQAIFIQQRQSALQSTGELLFFSSILLNLGACCCFSSSPAEPITAISGATSFQKKVSFAPSMLP